MKKHVFAVILCTFLILPATPGYCWDGLGHELVAQIAYDLLKPAAKAQVDQLSAALNSDPFTKELTVDQPFNAVTIATWPDEIKSLRDETRQYSPWHYIDLDTLPPVQWTKDEPGEPGQPIADAATIADVKQYTNPDSDVYLQIIAQSRILKDSGASLADRARALAFVEHFVGDIHQPLHAIGRQRGGNTYVIDLTTPDRHYTNLHAFWDSAYRYHVENGQITVDQLVPATWDVQPNFGSVNTWADRLIASDSPNSPALIAQEDPAAWAVESAELATNFAFPSDNSPRLSNEYVEKASEIARERITLAGYRLGNLLNSLLN
jgi:hypothetical protein